MVSLQSYLDRARAGLDGVWWLAVVPFAVALLSTEKFTQLGNADFHVGVSVSFPFPVTGGWAFLSLPDTTTGVGTDGVQTAVTQFGAVALGFALVSLPATALFVNFGLSGSVGGLAVLAPVGLVFDTATMAFVHDAFDLSSAEQRESFSASDDSTTYE
ncbi:hypothetical protein DM867_08110 [Halosegnis rubeus]|jgi:hypothetical protein|uniref:Uncharacterized protein n=1 Tax=Halosegnis rubeus TaxID=2212850 RepID=A0A5N5U5E8_9EURY|nr:hypothetical protein [Halosegnis rubeus]KAB7513765.1 hypothetical protein DM867_08110 [Halosegnis rubeus]KAB7514166.1 hypothetical protein DMP03_09765 [Halosegnis rubeus]KAB7518984.1 hypothetical protein DP108_07495 [Halosegnis rubeus]